MPGKYHDSTTVEEVLQGIGATDCIQSFLMQDVDTVAVMKLLLDEDVQEIVEAVHLRPRILQEIEKMAGVPGRSGGARSVGAGAQHVQQVTGWGTDSGYHLADGDGWEPSAYVLKIKGLPFRMRNDEFAEWFQQRGVQIVPRSLVWELRDDGKKTGTGFFLVKSTADQSQALALDREEMQAGDSQARTVRLFKSNELEYKDAGAESIAAVVSGGHNSGGGGRSDRGWPVKLKGCPHKTTKDTIQKFFQWAEITVDRSDIFFSLREDGGKTGNCYVLLQSREEVDKALQELDKQQLSEDSDRTVFVNKVRLDEFELAKDPSKASKGDKQATSIKCKMRQSARIVRDFQQADMIRDELKALGIRVNEDMRTWEGPEGSGAWGPETPEDLAEAEVSAAAPKASDATDGW
eukprot:TRINITY_DN39374_c0_g1_i1.p1 TRINITY_DN39374_c0_g1~~TRINITY_DN39374_c0_g1_i1.p1  ORF type:complete len:406 (+),score=147.24 TRINITY_DN39374_c0_g1_i1:67-1284(+)